MAHSYLICVTTFLWFLQIHCASISNVTEMTPSIKGNSSSMERCVYVTDLNHVSNKTFHKCKEDLKMTDLPAIDADLHIVEQYFQKLASNGFDDKCFSKCLLDGINMMTDDGLANIGGLKKAYQGGNMTENVANTVLKEAEFCNQKIGKEFPGVEGEDKLCRKVSALHNCWFQQLKNVRFPCDYP